MGVRQYLALSEMIDKHPVDHAQGGKDGVVEKLVYHIDSHARLLTPVFHDGRDNLTPCRFRSWAYSEKALFAAFDAGKDMREGLGAHEANASDEGVRGGDEWLVDT